MINSNPVILIEHFKLVRITGSEFAISTTDRQKILKDSTSPSTVSKNPDSTFPRFFEIIYID